MLLTLLVITGLASLAGCDSAFVTAADLYYRTVGSDYKVYVENDDALTQEEKNTRFITNEVFGQAISIELQRLTGAK